MEFIEHFAIADLNPADYNPRRIDEESFTALRESLKQFGIIKPVLLNANGTLIAGHQRTKASLANNYTHVPAIKLKPVVLKDEARLNLYHNSVETNSSILRIKQKLRVDAYEFIRPKEIDVVERGKATMLSEICRLIVKYGEWGSIVTDEDGNVLLNSDYALACLQLRKPCLTFTLSRVKAAAMMPYLIREYGEYNYEQLKVSNMNQTRCQMHRLRDGAKVQNHSTCYERIVIPNLKKDDRAIDFGEGQGDYRRMLSEDGYRIIGYEPFYRNDNKHEIWIDKIVAALRRVEESVTKEGLFDSVILDSVINSVTTLNFEHWVLLTCNALLKNSGTFYTATRNFVDRTNYKKTVGKQRRIEFLDKDGFSTIFREGMWTKQRFHTEDSFAETLSRYFEEVKTEIFYDRSNQITAICRKPKAFLESDYLEALEEELNPDYNGFRHGKHVSLAAQIIVELKENDRIQKS